MTPRVRAAEAARAGNSGLGTRDNLPEDPLLRCSQLCLPHQTRLPSRPRPPACRLPDPCSRGPLEVGLTSLLHEAEQVVQELLPLGVPIQFVQLWGQGGDGSVSVRAGVGAARPHGAHPHFHMRTPIPTCISSSGRHQAAEGASQNKGIFYPRPGGQSPGPGVSGLSFPPEAPGLGLSCSPRSGAPRAPPVSASHFLCAGPGPPRPRAP